MSITGQMAEYLNREGAATPDAIAAAIPELYQCGGAERALLLLRLNPQFERMDAAKSVQSTEPVIEFTMKERTDPFEVSSKWTNRGSGKTEKDTVHEAARQYFKTLGKPGAPITKVIMDVTKITGLDAYTVEQFLRMQFMTANTNIFNRLKRQEDE
jgi:hypothetical protein